MLPRRATKLPPALKRLAPILVAVGIDLISLACDDRAWPGIAAPGRAIIKPGVYLMPARNIAIDVHTSYPYRLVVEIEDLKTRTPLGRSHNFNDFMDWAVTPDSSGHVWHYSGDIGLYYLDPVAPSTYELKGLRPDDPLKREVPRAIRRRMSDRERELEGV